MGGFGWTELCPKCDRARLHGWREAANLQHSSQCRARLEKAVENTEKGRERQELAKKRLDRYTAKIGEDQIARDKQDKPDAAAEGEMRVPPQS